MEAPTYKGRGFPFIPPPFESWTRTHPFLLTWAIVSINSSSWKSSQHLAFGNTFPTKSPLGMSLKPHLDVSSLTGPRRCHWVTPSRNSSTTPSSSGLKECREYAWRHTATFTCMEAFHLCDQRSAYEFVLFLAGAPRYAEVLPSPGSSATPLGSGL